MSASAAALILTASVVGLISSIITIADFVPRLGLLKESN